MKVALLIGGLGRGGTEAQLMRLAKGLHARGLVVEVWCYAGASNLDAELEALGIRVRTGEGGSQVAKIRLIRGWMREFQPDVMHGFMKRASSLAVLAGFASRTGARSRELGDGSATRREAGSLELGDRGHCSVSSGESIPTSQLQSPNSSREARRRPAVIGSDLSTATYAPWRPSLWPSLVLFGFAKVVVTQTELNRKSLERLAPWLRGKVKVIRNGLDLTRFCPASRGNGPVSPGEDRSLELGARGAVGPASRGGDGSLDIEDRGVEGPALPEGAGNLLSRTARPNSELLSTNFSREARPFRFAVVGSVYRVKNPVGLVKAVALLRERGVEGFRVDWYGRFGLGSEAESGSTDYHEALKLIREHGLEEVVVFHGETSDIPDRLGKADGLIHPSLQEGFPNAVVEAMACGLPLVVSRVSDLPLVVETAENGEVVDQEDPASIAEGMRRLMEKGEEERKAMGARSRKLAEEWFGVERFVGEYVALYQDLVNR